MKVTPAHDPNDFAIGQRHHLPLLNILNPDGTLNENAGEFQGQDRFMARRNVVQALEAQGYLVKVEPHRHTVPYSDRGKVPIEPLLSTQWFVKIAPLAEAALRDFDEHQAPRFIPERWGKVYRDWLVKLNDWCISRQLWWGHRIPAWYVVSETGGVITDDTPFVVAEDEMQAQQLAQAQFGDQAVLEQDPDVLDTWFSSGLWPFSTLGWPEETPDFQRYYPTTTLVTGFDIIFFWVARMTMLGRYFTGKMPFQTVYIHGLVRDENNKKMSKSAGNGIDPLVLMEKYGVDALRFALVKEVVGAGQDIRLDYNRKTDESTTVEAARNFANKIWNAARFVLMHLEGKTPDALPPVDRMAAELSDRWILSRHHHTIAQIHRDLQAFHLGEAAKLLYEYIWGDFCDWYIELAKSRLQDATHPTRPLVQSILAQILADVTKLLHPFMPHITEALWQSLVRPEPGVSLARQPYPQADASYMDPALEADFALVIHIIRTIRNLRAIAEIKPGVTVPILLQTPSSAEQALIAASQRYICDLGKVHSLTWGANVTVQRQTLVGITGTVQVLLPLSGLVDVATLRGKIARDMEKIQAQANGLAARLNNPNFLAKAPPDVVQAHQAQLAECTQQLQLLQERLQQLE